jgi:hypothetical protein
MSWIAGWNKRIKLTISGSCIEGDLSNFPVMVHLDSTCSGVFNELGSNSKRISVVASDQSQCYVEVENWDESTNNAWLWVKIPTLSSGVDSDLYLYYDNLHPDNSAYVGTVGETSAQNVWDNNFVGVWHMSQDPTGGAGCIKDSTSNNNHGTPAGSMTSGDLVDGKIGKALDFDGNNDYVDLLNQSQIIPENADFTIESTVELSAGLFIGGGGNSGDNWSIGLYTDWHSYVVGGSSLGFGGTGASTSWASVSALRLGDDFKVYCDGIYKNKGNQSGNLRGATGGFVDHILLGALWNNAAATTFANGIIDEARISSIARSAPWLKATYYSNWNQLLIYGAEETVFNFIEDGYGYDDYDFNFGAAPPKQFVIKSTACSGCVINSINIEHINNGDILYINITSGIVRAFSSTCSGVIDNRNIVSSDYESGSCGAEKIAAGYNTELIEINVASGTEDIFEINYNISKVLYYTW